MVARLRMLLGLQYSLSEFFWHLCISHHITVILSSSPINTTRTVEVFDKISSKSESRHYNENNWYQSSNRNPKSLFLIEIFRTDSHDFRLLCRALLVFHTSNNIQSSQTVISITLIKLSFSSKVARSQQNHHL